MTYPSSESFPAVHDLGCVGKLDGGVLLGHHLAEQIDRLVKVLGPSALTGCDGSDPLVKRPCGLSRSGGLW